MKNKNIWLNLLSVLSIVFLILAWCAVSMNPDGMIPTPFAVWERFLLILDKPKMCIRDSHQSVWCEFSPVNDIHYRGE